MRYSTELCKEEKRFLSNRKDFVFEAMKSLLGERGPQTVEEVSEAESYRYLSRAELHIHELTAFSFKGYNYGKELLIQSQVYAAIPTSGGSGGEGGGDPMPDRSCELSVLRDCHDILLTLFRPGFFWSSTTRNYKKAFFDFFNKRN